jgi:phage terminase large subunit-like protein
MKLPTFKRDTSAERRKTLEAASAAAATLASLRAQRQTALLDSDLDAIEQHDNAVAVQERRVATLQERLRLLTEEQKRERGEQREQDREAAIAVIKKKLAGREVLAIKLEAAIKDVEKYYFQLTGFQSPVLSDWPFPSPRPSFGRINLAGINREVSWSVPRMVARQTFHQADPRLGHRMSSILVRDSLQRHLCGGDEFGAGLIPLESFSPKKPTMVPGGTGCIDTIYVTHCGPDGRPDGISTLSFKSYDQRRERLQSETVDLILCDERPPMDIYSELITRTAASRGIVLISYTAAGEDAGGVDYNFFNVIGRAVSHLYSRQRGEAHLGGTPGGAGTRTSRP